MKKKFSKNNIVDKQNSKKKPKIPLWRIILGVFGSVLIISSVICILKILGVLG